MAASKATTPASAPQIYLVDRPESEQSVIFAGHVAPPKNNDREIAIEAMNEVLGGSFNARINLNLVPRAERDRSQKKIEEAIYPVGFYRTRVIFPVARSLPAATE